MDGPAAARHADAGLAAPHRDHRPTRLGRDPYPATVAGAWTTYAAWAAICAVLTILATNHRDP
ncbi:hypothetical protein GCM10027614_26580 [Micromonospora vulcania]